MKKMALIIIYNHKFEKNIEVLESIYKGRFSNIYHLVPFYNGKKENVIPVYENSFYFQGYIAQGLNYFYKDEYQHYLFVADDMIINPIINEQNYQQHFFLKDKTCFIPEFINLHDCNKGEDRWARVEEAFQFKWNNIYGIEVKNEIPDYTTALQLFGQQGLSIKPLNFNQITPPVKKPDRINMNEIKAYLLWKLRRYKNRNKLYKLDYPLMGSYSDIFVVSAGAIHQFAHYCGVFAAGKLFVEIALPTAIVLSATEIVTEKDLKLQGKALWPGGDHTFLNKYEYSITKLLDDFPAGFLYLHPIKLSKWCA